MPEVQRRSRTMPAGTPEPHRVRVLGSFTLTVHGAAVPLGVDARRLIAYLSVHPRPQRRGALAADLWPRIPVEAAMRLLDDAVLAVDVPGLLVTDETGALSLAPDVDVDLAAAMRLVRTLPEVAAVTDPDLALLAADVLPNWTASWIAIERERFRQLRLHAIEERSLRLVAAGRCAEAAVLAGGAVRSAPSRESARRALIEAHLAHGNIAAAVAEYDEYRELLRSSVGAAPAFALDGLLPPAPAWPVLRSRSIMPRSAVQLPGLRSVRASGTARRLVAGGSVPGASR